ncbi:hypothetical protein YC2023_066485 [Brassica napus]
MTATKIHLNAFEYANFSDLRQILEDFWDNSWKTLGKLSKDFRKTLGRLSEDFLGNLLYFILEDFPLSLQKVFQSLLPKVVQRDVVKEDFFRSLPSDDFSRSLLSRAKLNPYWVQLGRSPNSTGPSWRTAELNPCSMIKHHHAIRQFWGKEDEELEKEKKDQGYSFELAFQCHRLEVNSTVRSEVMFVEWSVCLARERAVEEMKERRSAVHPSCRSMVIPEHGPSIFQDQLKPRSNHKLPE